MYESMAFKLFSSTFKNIIKMICTKFRKKKKKNENHPQFYHSDRYLSHITQGPENTVLPHRGSPQKLSQSAIKKNSANWRVSCVQLKFWWKEYKIWVKRHTPQVSGTPTSPNSSSIIQLCVCLCVSLYFIWFIWLPCAAGRPLVPQPGMESVPPARGRAKVLTTS